MPEVSTPAVPTRPENKKGMWWYMLAYCILSYDCIYSELCIGFLRRQNARKYAFSFHGHDANSKIFSFDSMILSGLSEILLLYLRKLFEATEGAALMPKAEGETTKPNPRHPLRHFPRWTPWDVNPGPGGSNRYLFRMNCDMISSRYALEYNI